MNINKLKLNELMTLASTIKYIPPSHDEDTWSTEDVYHAALYETLHSKYQMKSSELICGFFPPLKLFFKNIIRNYIKIMNDRREGEVELSS